MPVHTRLVLYGSSLSKSARHHTHCRLQFSDAASREPRGMPVRMLRGTISAHHLHLLPARYRRCCALPPAALGAARR